MFPKVQDLDYTRADTKAFDVFCQKPDPTSGVLLPIDLAGAKVWFVAKRFVTDADLNAKLFLTTPSDVLIVSAPGGQVRVTIPKGSLAGLPDDPLPLPYEVQVLEAAGALTTVQRGFLRVVPDVARATS